MENAEKEKERISIIGVLSTQAGEVRLSPEGYPTARNVQDESGNWQKASYFLDSPFKSLWVIGYSNLIYADILKDGVNVYLAGNFLFAIKGNPELTSSAIGHSLVIPSFSKKSISYEPIGKPSEASERIGILSHLYATDGEKLFVIELQRGKIPTFGAYVSAMSPEAKQVWEIYRAYVNYLREQSPENYGALMQAVAPFPHLSKKIQESIEQGSLKEEIGPILIAKSKENFHRWLSDSISEKDIFAISQDRAILRTGGILSGELATLTSEVPVFISIGTCLVPLATDQVREGVAVLNLTTLKDNEVNLYVNRMPGKVLRIARGMKYQSSGKVDAFLERVSPEKYKELYASLKAENKAPVDPSGAVPRIEDLKEIVISDKMLELAQLYGSALGETVALTSLEDREVAVQKFPLAVEEFTRKRSEHKKASRERDSVISEQDIDIILQELNKKGPSMT